MAPLLFHVLGAAETERHYMPVSYEAITGGGGAGPDGGLPAAGPVERVGWVIFELVAPGAGFLEPLAIALIVLAGIAAAVLLARHLLSEVPQGFSVAGLHLEAVAPLDFARLYRYRGAREKVRRALDEALRGCGYPRVLTPREALSGMADVGPVERVLYSSCGEEGCGGADREALRVLEELRGSCRG